MAGIKIHQYPLERLIFGDDDYYDIDYWDGAAYQTAKIKGSTIKDAIRSGILTLYSDNGSLTENRTVDIAGFNLAFTGGSVGMGDDLTVVSTDAAKPFVGNFVNSNGDAVLYVANTGDNVGIGTSAPESDAKLDIESTSKGILIPRMTTTERGSITLATFNESMIIYNTTTNQFEYIDSTLNWVPFGGASIYTQDGTIGSGRVATITDFLRFSGGRLDLSTTTDGFLMPRLTTAQMNAIALPTTNLLIYNTDLSGLYRYNGAAWVALSAGYGIIEIITDSDSGVPTYFADLQTALESCKTSGSNNVVKIHSDISLSAQIDINYSGTGTGNGYQFESLTIDLNGFSITNNETDSSSVFSISLSSSSAVFQRLVIKNGNLVRTSGTGTHYGIDNSTACYGNIETPNLTVYCENSYAAYFNILSGSTAANSSNVNNLGGAIFITNSTTDALYIKGGGTYCNFNAISKTSGVALRVLASCFNFSAENTSTGIAAYILPTNSPQVSNFTVKSNSGKALMVNSGTSSLVSNFIAKSVSGIAVSEENGSSRISNFTAITGNSVCLVAGNFSVITDGKCYNNSSSDTVSATNFDSLENVKAYNSGSGYGIDAYINQTGKKGLVLDCIGQSIGGIGGRLYSNGAARFVKSKNSVFISDLDTSSGHSLEVNTAGTGEVWVENCSMQVKNAGANGLYAGSACTIKAINNAINGSTTPINANVTVSASTDLGDGNRSY